MNLGHFPLHINMETFEPLFYRVLSVDVKWRHPPQTIVQVEIERSKSNISSRDTIKRQIMQEYGATRIVMHSVNADCFRPNMSMLEVPPIYKSCVLEACKNHQYRHDTTLRWDTHKLYIVFRHSGRNQSEELWRLIRSAIAQTAAIVQALATVDPMEDDPPPPSYASLFPNTVDTSIV